MNKKSLEFPVKLIGEYILDKRSTHSMIPWIVANVVRNACKSGEDIILEVNDLALTGRLMVQINEPNVLFVHPLKNVSYFDLWFQDENVFTFAIWEEVYSSTTLHVYKTINKQISKNILDCLKEKKNCHSESLQWRSKQYEVLFVRAVKLQSKNISPTFIDGVVNKTRDMKLNSKAEPKAKEQFPCGISTSRNLRAQSFCSNDSSMECNESEEKMNFDTENNHYGYDEEISKLETHTDPSILLTSQKLLESTDSGNASIGYMNEECFEKEIHEDRKTNPKIIQRGLSDSDAIDKHKENKALIFLIGASELQFISPDRKEVSLKKSLDLVVECFQGIQFRDHFGLVCSKHTVDEPDAYTSYIFQCKSVNVVNEIMEVLERTFLNSQKSILLSDSVNVFYCRECPMFWFHGVCEALNSCETPVITRQVIDSKVKNLRRVEQKELYSSLKTVHTQCLQHENEIIMHFLLEMCARKQSLHDQQSHKVRSSENSSISFAFNKLKSWASFENLFHHPSVADKTEKRVRSSTMDNTLVKNSPKARDRNRSSTVIGAQTAQESNLNLQSIESKGSIYKMFKFACRCSNFKSVPEECIDCTEFSNSTAPRLKQRENMENSSSIVNDKRKKTRKELRDLWKRAIKEHIIAIRLEKKNQRIQHSVSINEKAKLNYRDPFECSDECLKCWKQITEDCDYDSGVINRAVKMGVPKESRGDIWLLLIRRQKYDKSNNSRFDMSTPMTDLLKNLTEQQHEIIIDLSRTFPNHTYFAKPFGEGQLSLFNVLKAYSLIDTEVGYCQGIAFIAGILLLHTSEETAFELLKHLLITIGLREQYTPEMSAICQQLFVFSRLFRETNPELYDHFEKNDVSPSLYATPWFLTLFASQFSISFVARFFDILFLIGNEAVYRLSLTILAHFKEHLLNCESFESISQFLKSEIPAVDSEDMKSIFELVFIFDIRAQLSMNVSIFKILDEETNYFSDDNHLKKANHSKEKALNNRILQLLNISKKLESENKKLLLEKQVMETRLKQIEKDWKAMFEALTSMIAYFENIDMKTGDIQHKYP